MPTKIRKALGHASVMRALSHYAQHRVGGDLKGSGGWSQMKLVELVLDGAFHDRGSQLVLREVRVEQQPVVSDLVPLAVLPPLTHSLVEASAWQRIGNGVAHVVEGQAA